MGNFPVTVDFSKLMTMASETVDLINWQLPPTHYRAIPSEWHLHNAQKNSSQCAMHHK